MWWQDAGHTFPCCQRATPEDLAGDAEQFNCDTCQLARNVAALDPVNHEAWHLYQALSGPAVQAWHLEAFTLHALTDGWTADERADLVARLDVIRSLMAPPS